MTTRVDGADENGQVRVLEPLPGVARARVAVAVLPDTPPPCSPRALSPAVLPPTATAPEEAATATPVAPMTGDAVVDHYQPRTALGRDLLESRRAYILGGGKLLSWDELDEEMRERRGGAYVSRQRDPAAITAGDDDMTAPLDRVSHLRGPAP
ncbi:hypothetical protein [uncultured Lamprocystis sp.]|uniref:hypothetical protein n=1 Tax=uncultured Lamprocystis sp. TaxID=543132 RepID=UPI0025DDC461|nr:hypothetical protein [uncultured Lamprocystis sp.]